MITGFNTNVPFKGRLYHVQTEDSGVKNPMVITLLYFQGVILARKETNYGRLLEKPDWSSRLQELMKLQHKLMIKELVSGKHTPEEPRKEASSDPGPKAPEAPVTAPAQDVAAPLEASPLPEDAKEGAPPAEAEEERGQMQNSLDDILLDFIMKRHKKDGQV